MGRADSIDRNHGGFQVNWVPYLVAPGSSLDAKVVDWMKRRCDAQDACRTKLAPLGAKEICANRQGIRGIKFESGVVPDHKVWVFADYRNKTYRPGKKAPEDLRLFFNETVVPDNDELTELLAGSSLAYLSFPDFGRITARVISGKLIIGVPLVSGAWVPTPEEATELKMSDFLLLLETEEAAQKGGSK